MSRDNASGHASAKARTASSPPLVRAMANTLFDNDVDTFDNDAVVITLLRTGFTANQIAQCFEDVVMMATIRQANEKRKS